MPYKCDSCGQQLNVDSDGFFVVGKDGSRDCPMSDMGHTWNGLEGI